MLDVESSLLHVGAATPALKTPPDLVSLLLRPVYDDILLFYGSVALCVASCSASADREAEAGSLNGYSTFS